MLTNLYLLTCIIQCLCRAIVPISSGFPLQVLLNIEHMPENVSWICHRFITLMYIITTLFVLYPYPSALLLSLTLSFSLSLSLSLSLSFARSLSLSPSLCSLLFYFSIWCCLDNYKSNGIKTPLTGFFPFAIFEVCHPIFIILWRSASFHWHAHLHNKSSKEHAQLVR